MNTTDKIITALTPGSIFNGNGHVFRSVGALAEFAGMEEDELLNLLNGDLAQMVTCKPSAKGKGILVALIEQVQLAQAAEPVNIAAGPVGPEPDPGVAVEQVAEEMAAEAPLHDAPAAAAEEVVA